MPEIANSIRFGALCVASLLLFATAARAIGTTTGSREPRGDIHKSPDRRSPTVLGGVGAEAHACVPLFVSPPLARAVTGQVSAKKSGHWMSA